MKVLVTGAGGFVGRQAIAPLLDHGFEVHAVGRTPGAPGPKWHTVDLLDRDAAQRLIASVRPTHLLHLAWNAVPVEFWTTPENLRWLGASLALIENFIEADGQRVVIAGTSAEYASSAAPCVEGVTPLQPSTLYGASKHALNSVSRELCRLRGVSFAWGRIFQPFGPHEPRERVIPTVIRSLLRNEVARCTSGTQVRDFIDVEDCARAFVHLTASELEGEFNIGSGQPMRLADVLLRVAEKIGKPSLLELGALPHRPGDPPSIYADTARIRSTGWSEAYSIDEALSRTISWWRDDPDS